MDNKTFRKLKEMRYVLCSYFDKYVEKLSEVLIVIGTTRKMESVESSEVLFVIFWVALKTPLLSFDRQSAFFQPVPS